MPKSRKAKPTATGTARLQEKLDRLEAECMSLRAELEKRGTPCKAATTADDARRASTTAAFYKQVAAILDISADAVIHQRVGANGIQAVGRDHWVERVDSQYRAVYGVYVLAVARGAVPISDIVGRTTIA